MKRFFTSDYHLGHTKILKLDKLPFKTIEEYDQLIIKNQNITVSDDDEFYYLGDFALCKNATRLRNYFEQLKGIKYFIKGNHDHSDTIKLYKEFGTYLGEQALITVEDQKIVLNHYPMRSWYKSHRGTWLFFGHEHGEINNPAWGKSIDLCITSYNYKPLEFGEIKTRMDKLEIKYIGHHQAGR